MTFTLRVIVQYVFTVELVIECHHLATCSYLDDMILLPSSVPWGSFRVSELNGGGGEREERESGKDKAAKEQGKLSLSEIDFPSSKGKSRTGDGREAGGSQAGRAAYSRRGDLTTLSLPFLRPPSKSPSTSSFPPSLVLAELAASAEADPTPQSAERTSKQTIS